jgi:SPP1 gp7 family putative phage head morphogenesis protein
MRKIQPIRDRADYHLLIYREIKALLDRILFEPVLAIATGKNLENAPSKELLTALRSGRITYAENYFTGKFNAAIGLELRKLGADWNKVRKAYYLPQGNIPTDVKIAIAQGLSDIQSKIAKINEHLTDLQKTGAVPDIDFNTQFAAMTIDIDKQFKSTIPKDLEMPMTMTAFQKEAIRREYVENLNKYIKDFTVDSTERLRKKVIENVQEGYRASNLVGVIEAEHGVASRHALFLAKQETSLLVSTYRDSRYQEAGVRRYLWSTSHDSRVRHDHKVLDGKTFFFNDPPVTNQSTGAKNNPGYDFGCRCVAIPILEDDEEIRYGKK